MKGAKSFNRGQLIDRSIRAVTFVNHRKTFTVDQLAEHLGVHRKNAEIWFRSLSLHCPIVELKPKRPADGVGFKPAVYGVME
jgi:hypothetical protein